MEQYYVDIDGQTAGPFTVRELGELLKAGRVSDKTLFAKPNAVEWLPLSLILPIVSPAKPPPLAPPVMPVIDTRIRARRGDWVCTRCGHVGSTGTETPGNLLIEIILWLFFLIPGLIYSIWRISKRHHVCRSCGVGAGLIPATSPNAGAWVVQETANPEPSWGVAIFVTAALAMVVVFALYGELVGTLILGGSFLVVGVGWLAVRWAKGRRRSREASADHSPRLSEESAAL